MSRPLPQPALLEQNLALSCYLEALLSDKPMHLPVPAAPAPNVVVAQVLARTIEPLEAVAPVEVQAEAPAVAVQAPSGAGAVAAETAATEAGIPSWGGAPFQSLLLRVQGLSLALPLVKLHRILPWTEPTHLPGYVPWLLGIVRYLERNVRVVDTAALVMPDRISGAAAQERRSETVAGHSRQAGESATASNPASRHIVLIGDGRWGLMCDDVSSIITLDPAKVRWRSSRTKRPWLAGTAVEHLCALLDAERLAELLDADCPELPRQS